MITHRFGFGYLLSAVVSKVKTECVVSSFIRTLRLAQIILHHDNRDQIFRKVLFTSLHTLRYYSMEFVILIFHHALLLSQLSQTSKSNTASTFTALNVDNLHNFMHIAYTSVFVLFAHHSLTLRLWISHGCELVLLSY